MKVKNNKLYLIIITVLFLLLIGIVMILENSKSVLEKKKNLPVESNAQITSTTTTTKVLELKNFQTSLKNIVNGFSVTGNYKISTNYNGMEFNFNCTNYDEEANICASGSGLIKFNDVLLPLYTYSNDDDNYLLRGEDYYLYVTDKNIILSFINKEKKGTIKFYDKNGNFIKEINNYINGYNISGIYYNGLNPKIDNNNIIYYSCDNGKVLIKGLNLDNYQELSTQENVSNGICI